MTHSPDAAEQISPALIDALGRARRPDVMTGAGKPAGCSVVDAFDRGASPQRCPKRASWLEAAAA
jgi:hypothetical protein